MTKRYWTSPADRDAAPASPDAARGDEFGPEVAAAIQELRSRHHLDSPSCQHEGNQGEALDRLRLRLTELVPGLNRRSFLRLSGAAAVFSLAGCGPKHPDTAAPWSAQPEGTTLGTPQYFSSTLRDSGQSVAVMVKSYDGRPIKIEGNPDDPVGRGRCDTRTQAALLNLYDPDRLQHGPLHRQGQTLTNITWNDLDTAVSGALKAGKVALITPPVDSPSHQRLITALAKALPGRFEHAVLEAYPRQAEAQARQLAFGDAGLPIYHPAQADVLVAFGDFLGGPHQGLAEQVEFGDFRRLRRSGDATTLGQVIAFEPTFSQLGTCADLRQRVPAHLQVAVAWRLAEAVANGLGARIPAQAQQLVDASRTVINALHSPLAGADGSAVIAFAAERLISVHKSGRHSLVWAGGANLQGSDGGLALQLAVAWLNATLGNEGASVRTWPKGSGPLVDDGSAGALIDAAGRGEIQTLILWGVNPAYVWPEKAAALAKVATLVALTDRLDESAVLATYVVPALHDLESWGDAALRPGVYSVQQPCLPPLWDARAGEQSLIAFAAGAGATDFQGATACLPIPAVRSVVARTTLWQPEASGVQSWLEFVRETWQGQIRAEVGSLAGPMEFWNASLARGVVQAPLAESMLPTLQLDSQVAIAAPASPSGAVLILSASRTMRDGACLNNAWLQELPDPVSKICWDTYLAVSPIDAAHAGLASNDLAQLTVAGKALTVPVHVQEGQDPGTFELFLGWGRTQAGAVAELTATHGGFRINGFELSQARPLPLSLPAELAKGSGTYHLANTQGHDYREGRPVALDEVVGVAPESASEEGAAIWKAGTDGKPAGDVSTYGRQVAYTGHKWGMTVDMNTCIGCNACTVACTAENNVPTVGRDEVRKNRVMHWIRIHRYYTGTFDTSGDASEVRQVKQALASPCSMSRSSTSRCSASTATTRPASRCAQPTRPCTTTRASASRSTTAASALATAPTTARTRSAASTGTNTAPPAPARSARTRR